MSFRHLFSVFHVPIPGIWSHRWTGMLPTCDAGLSCLTGAPRHLCLKAFGLAEAQRGAGSCLSVAEHAHQTYVRVSSLLNDAKCHLLFPDGTVPNGHPQVILKHSKSTSRFSTSRHKVLYFVFFLHSKSLFFLTPLIFFFF